MFCLTNEKLLKVRHIIMFNRKFSFFVFPPLNYVLIFRKCFRTLLTKFWILYTLNKRYTYLILPGVSLVSLSVCPSVCVFHTKNLFLKKRHYRIESNLDAFKLTVSVSMIGFVILTQLVSNGHHSKLLH